MKLKLKNKTLLLKVELYTEQIKFLKKLVYIQEHTLRARRHSTSQPTGTIDENIRLPTYQLTSIGHPTSQPTGTIAGNNSFPTFQSPSIE